MAPLDPHCPHMGMIFGDRTRPRVMSPHVKEWFPGNLLLHSHSEILCDAALPRLCFQKNRSLVFCNLEQCIFHSANQSSPGLGCIDVDRKVSASDFNMVPNWWPESSRFETRHGLPLHWAISLPLHGPFFWKSCFAGWANPCRSPYMGSVCENHTHVKPMTPEEAIYLLWEMKYSERRGRKVWISRRHKWSHCDSPFVGVG